MNPIRYKYINNKNKPVILFLHGFLGSMMDWAEICELLRNDYSFLLLDLPWHGKSAEAKNTAEAARQIINLSDSLKLRDLYLYGYSMGGRLALYLTFRYPQYFRRVILESGSPGLKTERERQERIVNDEHIAQRLENEALKDFLSFWYEQPLFANLVKRGDFSQVLERRLQNSGKRLAQSLRTLGTGVQPSLWEKIEEIKIPVCLITGEKDEKFVKIARKMCRLNSQFTHKIVKNSGHTVYVENSAAVVNIIRGFFR